MDIARGHRDDVLPPLNTAFAGCTIAHGENGPVPAPADRMAPSGGQRQHISSHFAPHRSG